MVLLLSYLCTVIYRLVLVTLRSLPWNVFCTAFYLCFMEFSYIVDFVVPHYHYMYNAFQKLPPESDFLHSFGIYKCCYICHVLSETVCAVVLRWNRSSLLHISGTNSLPFIIRSHRTEHTFKCHPCNYLCSQS